MLPVLSWPLVSPLTPQVVLPVRLRVSVSVPVAGTVAGFDRLAERDAHGVAGLRPRRCGWSSDVAVVDGAVVS